MSECDTKFRRLAKPAQGEGGRTILFASDNQSGASDKILDALKHANADNSAGYGNDHWTQQAITQLKEIFECGLEAYFAATGTAANTLALSCLVPPWEVMLCHHQSHIFLDESTDPEFFTGGARMMPISQGAAKSLSSDSCDSELEMHTENENAFHPVQPDYLLLLCLRNDPQQQVITYVSSIDKILPKLTEEEINHFRHCKYNYLSDYSEEEKLPNRSQQLANRTLR